MHVELQSEQLDFLSDSAIYIQPFNARSFKEHFLAWCRKEYLFTQHMLSINSKPNTTLGPGDAAETKPRSISGGKVPASRDRMESSARVGRASVPRE